MCTNGKFVTNRYTGSIFWSECGHCKSCLQKKAAKRSSRIRNEYDGKTNVFFVTLDYDRLSAPYFEQSDFDKLRKEKTDYNICYSNLPVYRRYSIQWNANKRKYIRSWHPVELGRYFVDVPGFVDKQNPFFDEVSKYCSLPWLKKQPGKIGVIYFPDIQRFNKRLRSNLKYHGYNEKIKVFNCTEYGPSSQRPHAHLLIFAPNISQEAFHAAVIKSWSFGRRVRNPKSCQLVTQDPAGYVSSYVNCNSNVSSFLATYFPPKHSASKYFGHGRQSFLLEEVEKKVSRGDLSYDLVRSTTSGQKVFHLPIPKYVVNRFFPLFKGYSRFIGHQVLEFLSGGFDSGRLFKFSFQRNLDLPPKYWIDYSLDDVKKISIRLKHAYEYYLSVFPGRSLFDYARSFDSAWKVYKSTCYKHFISDDSVNDFYKYDNICLLHPDVQHALHDRLARGKPFIVENNSKPHYVAQTIKMTQMFDKYEKQKKVTDLCLNNIYV